MHLQCERANFACRGVLEIEHFDGPAPRRLRHGHASGSLFYIDQEFDMAPGVNVELSPRHGDKFLTTTIIHPGPVVPVAAIRDLKLDPARASSGFSSACGRVQKMERRPGDPVYP